MKRLQLSYTYVVPIYPVVSDYITILVAWNVIPINTTRCQQMFYNSHIAHSTAVLHVGKQFRVVAQVVHFNINCAPSGKIMLHSGYQLAGCQFVCIKILSTNDREIAFSLIYSQSPRL